MIPGFTDLRWRGERVARYAALLLPFAALGLVAGFIGGSPIVTASFGIACVIIIAIFAMLALATLAQRAQDSADAAVARALSVVFLFLTAAICVAAILAWSYATGDPRPLRFAPSHAILALVGWLTMLTMGVSARTLRPLLGSATRWPKLHIVSNSLMMLVAIAGACAAPFVASGWLHVMFACALAAALVYAFDGFDRILRASNPHRPAHVFVASAFTWLIIAAAAASAGWYRLAIIVALAGWLGQMIYAHLHHLGVRVIATTFAGDEDETRPWQLLDARVSWATVVGAQLAVLGLVFGLYVIAGILGLLAFATFGVNAFGAVRKVRTLPWRIPAR